MSKEHWPLPRFPEPDTEPFWRATKNHELRYQTCNDCGTVVFYPRAHCTRCLGASLTWNLSAGKGTLYSYTVVRQSRHPAFQELAPYAIAWIDLDEGFRLLSMLTDLEDPGTVPVGARVSVAWEDFTELSLPMFRVDR